MSEDQTQAPTEPSGDSYQPAATETVTYSDGTTATGTPPLHEQSPAQQGEFADTQPAETERPVPAEGDKVLFYPSRPAGEPDAPNGAIATITKVWGTGKGGCVNLDNGSSSVPCFHIADTGLPSGYYCLLFADEPDLRNPDVPEEPPVYEPADTDLGIFNRLAYARALAEVSDEGAVEVRVPSDRIHHFKDVDGRNMRIVFTAGGYAKRAVRPRA